MQAAPTTSISSTRRIEWCLFAAAFFAYAYFCQGGGWSQNARFAMVRALVEEGHYWIDDYLIYARAATPGDRKVMVRAPVIQASFELRGQKYALTWRNPAGEERFVDERADPAARPVRIASVAVTGDLAYARGHFHPSKAPGASLLAALPYFVVYHLERLFGANPDEWWTLTCNGWLTTVFSSGLLSALGCVLCFRLALAFSGTKVLPSLLTAIAFAFGTMFFPLATLLQDQNIAAVLLLVSFYLLYRIKEGEQGIDEASIPQDWQIVLSGLCAGYAAITNYVPAVAVVALAVYVVCRVPRRSGWKWFLLGVTGPLLLICVYNLVCFGAVWRMNYHYVNASMSRGDGVAGGVLVAPRWDVLLTVLFSPFRGLFFSAPVLLVGVYGMVRLIADVRRRAEAWLFLFLVGLYLWFNASFWSWHGGWIAVPRYLGPAVPFLAVPMVFGFMRLPKLSSTLALVSILANLLFTAVDPQIPTDFPAIWDVPAWPQWRHAPLFEYTLPMFLTGRAGPFLNRQRERSLREYAAELDTDGVVPQERNRLVEAKLREWKTASDNRVRREWNGPVSANTGGIADTWFQDRYPNDAEQTTWNSFNLGEFIFPKRRLSLLPLALVSGVLLWYAVRAACLARP
jgi:hypothetical protein